MAYTVDITNGRKIDNYETAKSVNDEDILFTHQKSGDGVVTAKQVKDFAIEPVARREHKDITSLVKDGTLSKAIAEQHLEKYGITIGDYFTGASGFTYTVAHKDPYYGGYNNMAVVDRHHVGIIVNTHKTHKYHSGDVSTVGYAGSELHAYLSGEILSTIESDIKDLTGEDYTNHLLAHSKLLTTALANWDWKNNQYISALTESQIYCAPIWSGNAYQQGEAIEKLEVFSKFRYNEILGDIWFWLRSLQSGSIACNAYGSGNTGNYSVASEGGSVVGLILFY